MSSLSHKTITFQAWKGPPIFCADLPSDRGLPASMPGEVTCPRGTYSARVPTGAKVCHPGLRLLSGQRLSWAEEVGTPALASQVIETSVTSQILSHKSCSKRMTRNGLGTHTQSSDTMSTQTGCLSTFQKVMLKELSSFQNYRPLTVLLRVALTESRRSPAMICTHRGSFVAIRGIRGLNPSLKRLL